MSSGTKKVLVAIGVIGLIAVVLLEIFFFKFRTMFIDDVVEDGGVGTVSELSQEELQDIFESVEFTGEADPADFEDEMDDAEDVAVDQGQPEMDGEITVVRAGEFVGVNGYNFVGQALVLADGTGRRVLRFENFEGQNGPALKVYLRADDGTFVTLGDLQGNIGNQNYEIPEDVDLDKYNTIDIWCEPFGVGFGLAPLAAA